MNPSCKWCGFEDENIDHECFSDKVKKIMLVLIEEFQRANARCIHLQDQLDAYKNNTKES